MLVTTILAAVLVGFYFFSFQQFFLLLSLLQLKMLRVGHDNSGSNSQWLLEEVVIYSLARGERYVFKCGRWIGGRNREVELPLGELF